MADGGAGVGPLRGKLGPGVQCRRLLRRRQHLAVPLPAFLVAVGPGAGVHPVAAPLPCLSPGGPPHRGAAPSRPHDCVRLGVRRVPAVVGDPDLPEPGVHVLRHSGSPMGVRPRFPPGARPSIHSPGTAHTGVPRLGRAREHDRRRRRGGRPGRLPRLDRAVAADVGHCCDRRGHQRLPFRCGPGTGFPPAHPLG